MDIRDRRGGFSAAEGCLFLAVILFVGILIAVGVIAFFRFQEPPGNLLPRPAPGTPVTSYRLPVASPDWQLAIGDWEPLSGPVHG